MPNGTPAYAVGLSKTKGTAPERRDILLKDGPITAFTSNKVRPIKFDLLTDCLRTGDGDWCGKRRDRAAVDMCDVGRRELWRSRDRARPLLQLGRWGNRRRRGRPSTQCWWGRVSPLYHLASCVCWSLRCLCERVESHRRRILLYPSTYTLFFPAEGSVCVGVTTDHSNTSTRL